ncbi:MAG: type IV secretory system conjugative DNA transfer family protein [Pseudomonadota bacterium]
MPDDYRVSTALASARWADPAYISDKYFYSPGDIWLGRNPHNFDQAVGVKPEEHVFLCASTGSGKGRSIIVNNIALWPGSMVVYDPKGDLPAICAPARGDGDEWTEPLGQKVIVLDPTGHSKSDKKYLGYFDPLSSLDPNDPGYRGHCRFIAETLIRVPESENHAQWAKMGRSLIKTMIEYVVSSPLYEPEERTLFTVLNLLKKGRKDALLWLLAEQLEAGEISKEEYHDKKEKLPDPFITLFREIAETAKSPYLRDDGDKLLTVYRNTPKTFVNQLDEAMRGLDWITDDLRMEEAISGTRNGVKTLSSEQRLDPRELKTNAQGVSVFIVLPSDEMESFGAWVQCVLMGIFASVRRTPAHPDLEFPILGILDEFSSLKKQDYIANAFDTLRDEGMRLMLFVQQAGWLIETYGRRGESFIENTCLQLFFGRVGETASDYLLKALGETEIIKFATTKSRSLAQMEGGSVADATTSNRSVAEGEATTLSFGNSNTVSESTAMGEGSSHTEGSSYSKSTGQQWNWNNSINWSNGRNWSEGNGRTMGQNYGPHVFFEGLEKSTSYGSSLNKSRGGSHNEGGAKARGGGGSVTEQTGRNVTDTRTTNRTDTLGKSTTSTRSEAHQTSRTITEATGKTHTYSENSSETLTESVSIAEQFHKKPLLDYHEFRTYLGSIADSEHDHPAYPGLMLAIIGREAPVLLRKSNYDQDRYFERLFSPHPKFPYITYERQLLLGYELSEDDYIDIKMPHVMKREGYEQLSMVSELEKCTPGTELLIVRDPKDDEHLLVSPCHGRVVRKDESGWAFKVLERGKSDHARDAVSSFFAPLIASAQAENERRIAERRRRLQEEDERDRLHQERKERLIAEQRAAREQIKAESAAEKQRLANKHYEAHLSKVSRFDEKLFSRLIVCLVLFPAWAAFLASVAGTLLAGFLWRHDITEAGFSNLGLVLAVPGAIAAAIDCLNRLNRDRRRLEDEGRNLVIKHRNELKGANLPPVGRFSKMEFTLFPLLSVVREELR